MVCAKLDGDMEQMKLLSNKTTPQINTAVARLMNGILITGIIGQTGLG